MKKTILVTVFLIFITTLSAFSQDKLSLILQNELIRNYDVLKKNDIPAYYISVRVEDTNTHTISCGFGAVVNNEKQGYRRMAISMRVGSPELDNMHYSGNLGRENVLTLPLQDIEEDIKLTLWRGIQDAYSAAKNKYEAVQTEYSTRPKEDDKAPDFSFEKGAVYVEPPLTDESLGFDEDAVIKKLTSISSILDNNRDILNHYILFQQNSTRSYFIDTEGALIEQNKPSVKIYTTGMVMADDGMTLQDYITYFGREMASLPSFDNILEDTRKLSETLSALKNAPKIDSYTGPVLLSGEVSGVFFHEFLGHRVEGARMKSGYDSQTLKKKVGETIIPKRISVFFDPSQPLHNGHELSGSYLYDDEGVLGQRVDIIKNGILKNFLMSRVPIEGFSKSNGHGRGELQQGTETRQSNLFITSDKPVTAEKLHKLFIQEIKNRGLKYGYRIDKVSGGLTMTSSASANAFYLNPLVVYRVYADERPDELVRGINIVGTPLVAFSQIIAESDDMKVFNGICGALSGGVPVSAIAPTMLIKELEFQKIGDYQKIEPFILERP